MSLNPSVSVDCVVFGFSKSGLKVLLLYPDGLAKYKLPGSLIANDEALDTSAHRVLSELVGLHPIYLDQFQVFDSPDRVTDSLESQWLSRATGLKIDRIVSVAYFSLIQINEIAVLPGDASWKPVGSLPSMAFDHAEIVASGLQALRHKLITDAVAYELLPDMFTLSQLHVLYETILGISIDKRNFRKKIKNLSYLEQTNEKEKDVSHKPAHYYRFNKKRYLKERKQQHVFTI